MRILILGGLGMIGHQIYSTLSQEFNQVKVCIRKSTSYAMDQYASPILNKPKAA